MADRGPVKIREGKIEDLVELYQKTYSDVISDIEDATTFGKIRKFAVITQINKRLEELGVDANKWFEEEIPQYYRDGANHAQQDLKALGVDITKASSTALINSEAIRALVDDASLSFAEALKGVSRSANRVLSDALKQQLNFIIAEGRLTGDTRKAVSATVEKRLRDEGLTALTGVDKNGRAFNIKLDNYARMLVRTKAVEARNQGLANRMLSSGYDLVQVSSHGSQHQACRKWEGAVLSLTGETSVGTELEGGIKVEGTYAQALSDGLFHPNCKHSINVLVVSLASKTKAYDNPYNYMSREEYVKRFPDSKDVELAKREERRIEREKKAAAEQRRLEREEAKK